MYLVLLRKLSEETFWYLAKDRKATTHNRKQAAEFKSRDEAIAVAQAVVNTDSTVEVKVVMQ